MVSEKLIMSEEAEACFVLPQREAVVHFARPNTRSTDTEVGSSDDGDRHLVDTCGNFGLWFLPLLGEPGG